MRSQLLQELAWRPLFSHPRLRRNPDALISIHQVGLLGLSAVVLCGLLE